MKNFIIALVIIGLMAGCFYSIQSCQEEKRGREQAEHFIDRMAQGGVSVALTPVDSQKDTAKNTQLDIYKPTEHQGENVADSYAVSPGYVDSLQQALDKSEVSGKSKDREITSLLKANLQLQAELQTTMSRDSLGQLWATYKDNAFDIRFNVDSGLMNIGASVPIGFADYTVKGGLFKKDKFYTAIYSTDTRFKLNDVNRVVRTPDFNKSRFGIDLSVGPVITPKGMSYMGVGLSVGYRLIEF